MSNLATQTVVEILGTKPSNVRVSQVVVEVLYSTVAVVPPPPYRENIHTYMLESIVNK